MERRTLTMRGKSHFLNIFAILFLITNNLLHYSHATCTSSIPNIASKNFTLLTNLIKPVLDVLPTFDNTTIPNFATIVEEFQSGLDNEDIYLNITELLTKYGYPTEQYEVETSDGYLLNIFRIPGKGSAVFLMHGIMDSSDNFVTTGPNRGLAYLLANAGYDVWLGNARGNVHSRKHVTLSPNCAEFWDFTWDEIGRYDLPAMIDFALKVSDKTQLTYVGFNQGVTSFFVMASEKPEYNGKISLMIALSAVTFLKYSGAPVFRALAPIINPFNLLTQAIGLYEFFPRNPISKFITSLACSSPISATIFCSNLAFILYGFDYSQIDATNLPVFYGHFPAGAATKQFVHYGQLVFKSKFRRFDKGLVENLSEYGSITPPEYPLNKVSCKIVIFHSDNDWYSKKPDRKRLLNLLPNVVETYRVPYAKFTTLDFISAKDLKFLVNDKVLEFIKKYTN